MERGSTKPVRYRVRALEGESRAHADPRDVQGFHTVMAAVEEVTWVRLRER
ncbi:MAG: hypothetical protein ABW277_10130 [Longimicrobiaceae bacterium]